ncbi:putative monooxygenase [Aspergillus affinis]|uniref:putative monooxygenase n=1 Tax=Aspergillus affinis TaxID=1070780 RepID=UPI0022FEF04B|nr:FAD binding domain protein [Aspergillus affinis]KAI9037625.1 FAD binding domain protein [Aspergillus affinis]
MLKFFQSETRNLSTEGSWGIDSGLHRGKSGAFGIPEHLGAKHRASSKHQSCLHVSIAQVATCLTGDLKLLHQSVNYVFLVACSLEYSAFGKVPEEAHLRIIVVGAGLSGLATAISCASHGHSVQVIEQAKELAEVCLTSLANFSTISAKINPPEQVGAGLQITPNASRLFHHWQLPSSIWTDAAEPTSLTVHRYTGQILAQENEFDRNIRAKYNNSPFIDLHRVDLQQALFARAKDLGVTFHLDTRVERIDFATSTVYTPSPQGRTFTGDLIVAADGLWSKCRECYEGRKDDPLPTGDLAYRIVLNAEQIRPEDADLRQWVESPQCHFWVGPGAHVVAYSLRGGKMFNIVLLVPDTLPPGVSRQAGSVDEMKALFTGWDPVLTRFLNYVDNVDKWKLMHHGEMETWVNDKSNLVFMYVHTPSQAHLPNHLTKDEKNSGDACHPMLPYLAQGANSSLEDGAVLGGLLGHLKSKSHLPQVLRLYESLRKSRGEAIVKETFKQMIRHKQRNDFHMPNGEAQEKRDQIFLSQLGKKIQGPFPSRWTCPEVQPWLYGYDAIQEVENAVAQNPELFSKTKNTSNL